MSYTPHQQALIEMGQRLPAVEAALKAERARVRVLREALEYAVNQVPEMGTVPGVKAALATTAPDPDDDFTRGAHDL